MTSERSERRNEDQRSDGRRPQADDARQASCVVAHGADHRHSAKREGAVVDASRRESILDVAVNPSTQRANRLSAFAHRRVRIINIMSILGIMAAEGPDAGRTCPPTSLG